MISFIIVGRNEEKNLKRCFESIYNTIHYNYIKDYEIIYVDSKSTDRSISIAEEYEQIKICRILGYCNAAIARNIGATESNGNILFFIDGDMEIEKEFISHVLDQKMNLKYDMVSGQVLDIIEGIPDKLRYPKENSLSFKIIRRIASPGGIFIIKKENWKSVNGMKTKYNTGEEPDLLYRLLKKGFTFIRIDENISKHYTYSQLDMTRKWKFIFNKEEFYSRCVIYRDHFFNRYMYYGMWENDKTFILLTISIALMLVFPKAFPVLVITYFLAVFLRSVKQVKNISGIRYILYYFFLDLLNLIFLFTFFPKDHSLEYSVITEGSK